jgi:hypothetical protein
VKTTAACIAALAVAGCAGNAQDESVMVRNDAVEDFIEVADLTEIEHIRIKRDLHHKAITEDYVLIYDGQQPYLLAFQRRCHELNETQVTPDFRYEARKLYARYDTYRGCRIATLYEITSGQAAELSDLARKSKE